MGTVISSISHAEEDDPASVAAWPWLPPNERIDNAVTGMLYIDYQAYVTDGHGWRPQARAEVSCFLAEARQFARLSTPPHSL